VARPPVRLHAGPRLRRRLRGQPRGDGVSGIALRSTIGNFRPGDKPSASLFPAPRAFPGTYPLLTAHTGSKSTR